RIEVRSLRNSQRNSRLKLDHARQFPPAQQCSFAGRKIIRKAGNKNVRDITGREIALQLSIEAVSNREIRNWTSQDRRIEHRRSLIDQFRSRIRHEERKPMCEPLFQLCL